MAKLVDFTIQESFKKFNFLNDIEYFVQVNDFIHARRIEKKAVLVYW